MSASRIARRYAAAVFHIAEREGAVADVAADLRLIQATAEESPALLSLMKAPLVPKPKKLSTLHGLFDAHLRSPLTARFISLLVERNREEVLSEIGTAFGEMADEHAGIVPVEVRSVIALTEEQMDRLKARLDSLTGKNTRLEPRLDPILIGGMLIRIGDTIYDGSVRGYLEQFGDRIRSIPVSALVAGARDTQ
jgi:F-type H+-transporting ATPase subunit delta